MLGGFIGSEHSEKFLDPFAFCSVQTFTQAIKNGMIADLSLTIAFRIIGCGESIDDLIISTEAGHLHASEVCLVVGDNGVGGPKRHMMFLPKKFGMLPSDFGERHRLNQFGQVVGGY